MGGFTAVFLPREHLASLVPGASHPSPSEHAEERMGHESLVFHEQSLLTKASGIRLGRKGTVMTPHVDPKK